MQPRMGYSGTHGSVTRARFVARVQPGTCRIEAVATRGRSTVSDRAVPLQDVAPDSALCAVGGDAPPKATLLWDKPLARQIARSGCRACSLQERTERSLLEGSPAATLAVPSLRSDARPSRLAYHPTLLSRRPSSGPRERNQPLAGW